MTFIVAFLVFIFWTIYRLYFPENLLLDEILIKPFIWLTPVYFFTRFVNLGFTKKNLLKNIFIGLGFGLLFSLERLFANPNLHFTFSWFVLISSLATAITEEIFFRGYLLNRWLKIFPISWQALLINGLFFTAFHLPIALFQLHYQGYDLFTYLLSNFVSGFVNILLFYTTGSIYTPIANHFIWNVFSSMFR
jgi:membrane protease YdiL (CAAX protease family)